MTNDGIGWSSGTVNLGNQVHIMIDPKAMGASTPAYERRPLKDIVLNGLDPVYGGSLTAIRPLEVTMLHEVPSNDLPIKSCLS